MGDQDIDVKALQPSWETHIADLRGRIKDPQIFNGNILPPTPSPFKPDPLVNNQLVQQLLHKLITKIPAISNTVGRVTMGPNANTQGRLGTIPIEHYPETNLLGHTNMTNGDISINPSLGNKFMEGNLLETLSHELAHSAGRNDDSAYKIGNEMVNNNPSLLQALLKRER